MPLGYFVSTAENVPFKAGGASSGEATPSVLGSFVRPGVLMPGMKAVLLEWRWLGFSFGPLEEAKSRFLLPLCGIPLLEVMLSACSAVCLMRDVSNT